MKKTLIALAALTAGAAFAQSSVTMYGVADLSLSKSTGGTVALSSNGFNNGSSRLGVRGSEDLGGGMKANFNFEQGINAETGATDATTFQRAANMSLSGGFGTLKLGRTLTPSFFGIAAWELTGTANYSVVAGQFGFAGAGSRNSSEISYTSPNISGFTVTLGTVLKGDNGGVNGKIDANAVYANGPLAVALSYNKVNGAATNYALGAKYNFGAFQVAGSYQNLVGGATKGVSLGAGTMVGPVSLVLDVAKVTAGAKNTDVLLEAKYALSKRTTPYAAFYREGLASVNTFGVGVRHNF